ncbi:MAG: glycosyltransferase family 39 protein [Sporolactobacillus sp.]
MKKRTQKISRIKIDWMTASVIIAASMLSIAAFLWYFRHGLTLNYFDTISHLEIARRVIDGPTKGLAQLGAVWLPFPHLLMLPLIWSNVLYFNGIAASFFSMLAYIIAGTLIYKIVFQLSGNKTGAVAGALIFLLNPNILYMQSTPMTELLLFACMTGMVYETQRWIQTDRYQHLIYAAIASVLATLSRYESWVLLLALSVVVICRVFMHYSFKKAEGTALAFFYLAFLGIGSWMIWCGMIFGNILEWQNGDYAKSTLWVSANDPDIGNWLISAKTYYYAVVNNLSLAIVLVMFLGALVMIIARKCTPSLWPALCLFVMIPFFIYALESGQRPLYVEQINGSLYNVRFGLLMIIPAAVFGGLLVSWIPHKWWYISTSAILAGLILLSFIQTFTLSAITVQEPSSWQESYLNKSQLQVAEYMKHHYHGGFILSQSFGNEQILFKALIPPTHNIYEGSYKIWQSALKNPMKHHVEWILMRRNDRTDQVYRSINRNALSKYRSVYQNSVYELFER